MSHLFMEPFDASLVAPESFEAPPVLADYHVRIAESEAKPTKDGNGGFLELTLEILDPGPYLGRMIPYRLNLYNTNPKTCAIARAQLSSVCHVTRVQRITDARELHGIPFMAKIGPQTDNPNYVNVFAVMDLNGNRPKVGGAAPTYTAAPVAPAPAYAPAPAPAFAPNPAFAPPAAAAAPSWGPPAAPAPAAAPTWPGAAAPAPAAPGPPTWPGAAPAAPAAVAPAAGWQPSAPPLQPPWAK